MTLRDQFGELEYHLCDEFTYKGCVLSIVCPDTTASRLFGKPVISVRLRSGILEHEGECFQIEEGKNPPLFIFEEALVGACLRDRRSAEAAHPPEFEALIPEPLDKPEPKTRRAKKIERPAEQDQPTLW